MDVRIKTDNLKFKFRVSAVFIYEDKLLVDSYGEGRYCLPGGYVALGETSTEGMIREIKEETTLDFNIVKFMGVIENFFTNKNNDNTHEIDFYYQVELNDDINKFDLNYIEDDHGFIIHHDFKWIDLKELDNYDIVPNIIKKEIKENKEVFHYIIKE